MCVSCGCGAVEDRHGDSRHITLSDLRAAAEAAQINMLQLKANLDNGMNLRSPATDDLVDDIESMNHPLPGGQFSGRLESTPYTE